MVDLLDFAGSFGDFNTFCLDSGLLKGAVVRMWYHPDDQPDGEEILFYKMIVGFTVVPGDILLHVIDVEGEEDCVDVDELIQKNGIEFHLLSNFSKRHGFSIRPEDQIGYN